MKWIDEDLLNDLVEYFENKADVDGEIANKEMRLLVRLRNSQEDETAYLLSTNANKKRLLEDGQKDEWIRKEDVKGKCPECGAEIRWGLSKSTLALIKSFPPIK